MHAGFRMSYGMESLSSTLIAAANPIPALSEPCTNVVDIGKQGVREMVQR
jgi:hypothetical protein